MAENLKTFESLKENGNASLSSQEKADLRKISPDDIRSQKEKVWEKSFVVGGKLMKLKDIVKNLAFDEEGEKAELKINGKKVAIGWGSELWAAIQVYAIAHNKSIGRAWIDGKVGRDTVKWLQSTQNSVKAEERAKKTPEKPVDQDEVKEQSVARLVNAIYTEYVGKYKDAKYNLLDTRPGVNQGTLIKKRLDGNKVTITYKSAIWDKEYQEIVVDASTCKVWKQYSVDKFWKAIENAISKKEAELKKAEDERIAKEKLNAKQEAIVKGVESFDIKKFSAKAQAYLKEKNFVYGNRLDLKDGLFSWTGIAFDEKWNLHFWKAFYMTKSQIDSTFVGGKFNSDKFKSILSPYLDKKADEYFKNKANMMANWLGTVTVNSLNDAEKKVNEADREIKKIEGLWVSVTPENKKAVEVRKNQIQILKEYKDVSTAMEEKLNNLIKKVEYTEGAVLQYNALRDFYISLKEKKESYNWKNVYNVYSKISWGKDKYNKLVEKARSIGQKYEKKSFD